MRGATVATDAPPYVGTSYRLSFDEADAYLFEAIAFDKKPEFTPDQFNKVYDVSEQLKTKYREMYERNFR
ncbi:hypothetical protein NP590_20150 [Methylomonas sp. SURF-2]|uniref:Uncharacterized protein n=1 Tax=Methylomonas subterranea TaxID=2952225 RepID=A0ABT1TLS5_9GAMM|nr:hypothetical protein [Methylomonas sp. SURF-2]MCQ8106422.1 hypothetical protein [Methylomonas sp. SURF-2]